MASCHLTQSKSQSLKITNKTPIWPLATLLIYALITQLQTPGPLPFFEHNKLLSQGPLHFGSFFLGRFYLKILSPRYLLPLLKCQLITGCFPNKRWTPAGIPLPSNLSSLFSIPLITGQTVLTYFGGLLLFIAYLLPPLGQGLCFVPCCILSP